jgi:hypothetical protein
MGERMAVMPSRGRRAWTDMKDPFTPNEMKKLLVEKLGNSKGRHAFGTIDYKTAAKVKAALNLVAGVVKTAIGKRKYAMLVESTFGTLKSTHWLTEVFASKMGRWPDAVVALSEVADMRAVMRRGIRTFVYFDDGMYSGSQVSQAIRAFEQAASGLRANEITHHRNRPRLYVALGFASQVGAATLGRRHPVLWSSDKKKYTVQVFSGDLFADIPNSDRAKLEVLPLQTLSLLAHKLPNSVSIPAWLVKALGDTYPKAPYKKVYNYREGTSPPNGYTRAYWARLPNARMHNRIRFFVKGSEHKAFVNVGGQLVRRANLDYTVPPRKLSASSSRRPQSSPSNHPRLNRTPRKSKSSFDGPVPMNIDDP